MNAPSGRWSRTTARGAAFVAGAVTLAACGSGATAHGSQGLTPQQARAYATSQFTKEDRQAAQVLAPEAGSFLAGKDTVTIVGSTSPSDGDTVPSGIWPVATTAGSLTAGDVLVDNGANRGGRLGAGTSVVDVHADGQVTTFAQLPRTASGCPGQIGLTPALVQLETGWVIVGSAPVPTATPDAAAGCLLVLSSTGALVGVISGPYLDGPQGAAVSDAGATATLFVSNTLVGFSAATSETVDRGDVVRLSLSQSTTKRPVVTAETTVAAGLPERTDPSALARGPGGLALSPSGTLYVADTLGNRIASVPDALSGSGSTGPGVTLSRDGQLAGPLGLTLAPDGDLLASNSGNGKIIEITPAGRQVGEYYADQDVDQDPPGNGELSSVAVDGAGSGVLFTKGEASTLDLLH